MRLNGPQTDLLGRMLAASELRAKVIAANVAIQNTPGYVRQVVRFEDLLREALDDSGSDLAAIEPSIDFDEKSPARPDGNNVSLELELNAMRENRLLYETYAAMLAGHFDLLRAAVTEGR
jgi:flagellar basal-body rod protein FlgB